MVSFQVVVIEETNLIHRMFFSDLVFTRDLRPTCVVWHPTIPGVVAMATAENGTFEQRMQNLSRRLAMPGVVTVWSMEHPFFPQASTQIEFNSKFNRSWYLMIKRSL